MRLYVHLAAPHVWATVDKNSQVTADGVVAELGDIALPPKLTELIGVVPGESVVMHRVRIPARSPRKIAAALPYALEDQLATDVEELFFAVLDRDRDGNIQVAVIERADMGAWLKTAGQLPRPLDGLVPEYGLLPFHPQAPYTMAITPEQKVCIRGRQNEGICVDRANVLLWWRELRDQNAAVAVNDAELARELVNEGGNLISQWDIGGTFADWLRYGTGGPSGLNLLQGEYAPTHQRPGSVLYKVAAALLIAAVLIRGTADAYQYFDLRAQAHDLNLAMAATLREAFPGARIQAPGSERRDMESRLARLRNNTADGEFQSLLGALAGALKNVNSPTIRVEAISYRNRELTVTCATDSFDSLNNIKQQLQKNGLIDANLASSSSLENKVTGKFTLKKKFGA